MKLGDGKLPPFIGYLPPVADGVLLELVNRSYKDYPPRRGRTGAQLSQERILAIESVYQNMKKRHHFRAVEVLAGSMRERKPFCLYLRNFVLGARVYPARDDPFGMPQVATMLPTRYEVLMQRRIEAVVSPSVPALSICNPASSGGDLPAFVVRDDEWEPLARTLVRNAGVVVMYLYSATSGVLDELELIRSEGKQNATLVVIEEDDPTEATAVAELLVDVRRNEPQKADARLEDFPHQVRRRGESWDEVDAKLLEIASADPSPPVDERIGVPVEYGPHVELKEHCTAQATKEFDAAMELIGEKRFEEAEDILTRSIAYAFWGRDMLGTAVTLNTLGLLNLKGFKAKGDAGAYFEMALDLCGEIRENSPTAAELYPAIKKELDQLRGDAKTDEGR